jgi:hypothetical protein
MEMFINKPCMVFLLVNCLRKNEEKILIGTETAGPSVAISSVIKKLYDDDLVNVEVIAESEASKSVFDSNDIKYTSLFESNSSVLNNILRNNLPDLILTGASFPYHEKEETLDMQLIGMSHFSDLVRDFWNIPSLAIMDLWGFESRKFGGYIPSKVAVLDEHQRQEMIEQGFEDGRLVVTGNPNHDKLGKISCSFSEKDEQMIKEELSIPKNLFTIVFYGGIVSVDKQRNLNYDDNDCLRSVSSGINMANASNSVHLVLKKHPSELDSVFEEQIRYLSSENSFNVTPLPGKYDVSNLSMASDLIVSARSGLLLEALIMGKNVISLQPGRNPSSDDFLLNQIDMIPHSYESEEGSKLMCDSILKKEIPKEYIRKRESFKVDGNATERVTGLVYRMLNI